MGLLNRYVALTFYGGLIIMTFIIVIPNRFTNRFYLVVAAVIVPAILGVKIFGVFVVLITMLIILV